MERFSATCSNVLHYKTMMILLFAFRSWRDCEMDFEANQDDKD